MMYKATLALSLLFLAVVGSAQSDGGADTSAQPPSSTSSMTDSKSYPTDIPMSTTPTPSDKQSNGTRPSGCFPHNGTHSAIPTDQLPSGVSSSAAHDASSVSKPHFNCEPGSELTIPTGTESIPAYSAGALPFTDVPNPIQTGMVPTGSPKDHDGNFTTLPTGTAKPFSSSSGQDDPPVATSTASYGKLDSLSHLIIVFF